MTAEMQTSIFGQHLPVCADEENEEKEVDLEDIPEDLMVIGSPALMGAWIIKQSLQTDDPNEDGSPPAG